MVSLPIAVIKCPDKINLRDKGFVLDHNWGDHFIGGEGLVAGAEAAGDITPTVRKQRMNRNEA